MQGPAATATEQLRGDAAGERPATIDGPKQGPDRPGQLGFVEVAHDPRPLDETHLAVLLGDDDHQGIALLGDPEGSAMARPEPRISFGKNPCRIRRFASPSACKAIR